MRFRCSHSHEKTTPVSPVWRKDRVDTGALFYLQRGLLLHPFGTLILTGGPLRMITGTGLEYRAGAGLEAADTRGVVMARVASSAIGRRNARYFMECGEWKLRV